GFDRVEKAGVILLADMLEHADAEDAVIAAGVARGMLAVILQQVKQRAVDGFRALARHRQLPARKGNAGDGGRVGFLRDQTAGLAPAGADVEHAHARPYFKTADGGAQLVEL